MLPCESSQTPCVLPYLMVRGNSPQSWMASYWYSPCPRIGTLLPALAVAPRNAGAQAAAAVVARKLRRVSDIIRYSRSVHSIKRRERLANTGGFTCVRPEPFHPPA